MRRRTRFEHHCDSSLFDQLQLMPRQLATLGMNGFAVWLRAHLVPFRKLVLEHHRSAVIVAKRLDYEQPFKFEDADVFVVETEASALLGGNAMRIETLFSAPDAVAPFARDVTYMRTLAVEDGVTLTATPAPFNEGIMALFRPDERDDVATIERLGGPLADVIAAAYPCLASGELRMTLGRQACEVAEQWCFAEIPGHAVAAREKLVREAMAKAPALRKVLRTPLRSVELDLRQPMYLFDELVIKSRAYQTDEGFAFVHELTSETGGGSLHGVVVERL